MNLIEAIKSGRPFRRPCFPEGKWYSYPNKVIVMHRSDGEDYMPDKFDILADDWKIQEPTVTITSSQFWDAALEIGAIDRVDGNMIHFSGPKDTACYLQRLAKKLGLCP